MTADIAAELAALVDTLLPGEEPFPPASGAGAHRLLSERWPTRPGLPDVEGVVSLVVELGGSLLPMTEEGRAAVLRRFEREHLQLFDLLRRIVYLSYYETPAVVAAIQALGHDYNIAPQPAGYHLRRFSPAQDAPYHRRGAYVSTEEVRRVDLTGLDYLQAELPSR